jgi:macrodomain Ter protein organizer (MatP/YcbG family)
MHSVAQRKKGHVGRRKKHPKDREIEMLSARVRYAVYEDMERFAKTDGLTLAQVVRKAVEEFITRKKQAAA